MLQYILHSVIVEGKNMAMKFFKIYTPKFLGGVVLWIAECVHINTN